MVVTTLLIGALAVGAVLTFFALGAGNPVPWLFLIGIAAVFLVLAFVGLRCLPHDRRFGVEAWMRWLCD